MGVHEHKRAARGPVSVFVLTVSDTRTVETDESGALLRQLLEQGGHRVIGHEIVPDSSEQIREVLLREVNRPESQCVVITGGTGISPRDVTPETVSGLLDKELTGFGELFRMLSYQEIGSAAMMSRAVAGIARTTLIFATPGSRAAVRLAVEKLILPELGHLAHEAVKGMTPAAP